MNPLSQLSPLAPLQSGRAVDWQISADRVAYPDALAAMEARIRAIRAEGAADQVWLLEHPPLYTAGTSADPAELLDGGRFPVYQAGRGGRYTYHGPGQRVAYVMLDLRQRGADIRLFVRGLEQWLIDILAAFHVKGFRAEGRIGVWVESGGMEKKIAAIGVRVKDWVSYHGVAVNVDPDLSHFRGIVPCGLAGFGVTSLADQGVIASLPEVDLAMKDAFAALFVSPPR